MPTILKPAIISLIHMLKHMQPKGMCHTNITIRRPFLCDSRPKFCSQAKVLLPGNFPTADTIVDTGPRRLRSEWLLLRSLFSTRKGKTAFEYLTIGEKHTKVYFLSLFYRLKQ